jgi:uncharacterized protein (TIGR02145 family)
MIKKVLISVAIMAVGFTSVCKAQAFVEINGVKWAACNVGEKGKFVSSPEQYGNNYTWDGARNACPKGWRLPTEAEFKKLINAGGTWTTQNGIYGYKFGNLFLPAAGFSDTIDGTLFYVGSRGYYWSSTQYNNTLVHYLSFSSTNAGSTNNFSGRGSGFIVRCVKE